MKCFGMDLDMIIRTRELVDRCRFESNLTVSEKNDLHFMAGYLEGLKLRMENDLKAGHKDVLSSDIQNRAV